MAANATHFSYRAQTSQMPALCENEPLYGVLLFSEKCDSFLTQCFIEHTNRLPFM